MKGLKVYVWEGVFTDYTSGMAVAIGRSKEEAIEVLRKSAHTSEWNGRKWSIFLSEGDMEELERTEPKIFPLEVSGFWVWGGG